MIHAEMISSPSSGCRKITQFPCNFPDARITAVEIWNRDVLVERLEVDGTFTWPRECVERFNRIHAGAESGSVAYAIVSDVDEL
ncbi:hypothetical protein [Blastopirellula retiformator]|uniref:Uncharacterized protein n=1 Tax=Blastopirellula retiformator TaxID=2527970 RepID=A0A5C5UWK7_9BACT|nr:hypothetical protein [Blastopirellula retiformator]TWT30731.1 hypothetical protein Enr8_42540 [Blastopirellula retiformator]